MFFSKACSAAPADTQQALWATSKLTILENYQIKIYIHLSQIKNILKTTTLTTPTWACIYPN